jgi:hypothetical protein
VAISIKYALWYSGGQKSGMFFYLPMVVETDIIMNIPDPRHGSAHVWE